MTTAAGTPVADNQNTQTAGPHGPALMQDYQLLEKMAHFNRERVPERVVHAKGAGAHGTFTVAGDISRYTRTQLFAKVGNTCPMCGRFSTVAGEMGSADPATGLRDNAIHPLDLTKVWPHADYPLIDVDILELNRNPENYFAEAEQAAFEPGNMPPGMGASPDKVLAPTPINPLKEKNQCYAA